jgi:alpha-D-ribose 1-methylphosphonate 5-triphosphate diphosphatase PhnM
MNVLIGAPNIVRGWPHSGNVAAADLAAEGLSVVQQVWRQAKRVF